MKAYDAIWSSGDHDGLTTSLAPHELVLLEGRRTALDLGCGVGQNALLLAKRGIAVTAIDYSSVAVEKTRALLAQHGAAGRVLRGDIYSPLPFRDGEFDAIISYQVINHNYLEKIRSLLLELHRVLAPGGLFSVKVSDSLEERWTLRDGLYYGRYNTYKKLSERTFLPVDGAEKGIVHFLFDRETLLAEMQRARFALVDVRSDGNHLLGNFTRR